MESDIARKRAELSGKATDVLDSRTLESSHRRLANILSEGMTVLDIGCGTGAITCGIAELVGPKGRVVGIDSNPALIKKARQLYAHIPGLSFEVGDIFTLPYTEEYDIVAAARVLQWVANPLKALSKMKTATKKGGRILVLDYNHEKIDWEPEPPVSMRSFYAAFLKWRSTAGMNNRIADRLPDLFNQVGIRDIKVTPQHERVERHTATFHTGIGIWADVAASRGKQMVQDGFLTEAKRAIAEKEYRQWIKKEAMSQIMYLLTVEGYK